MSNVPPPLPGESIGSLPYASAGGRDDALFWSLFRLGLIVWSATILVRHATYWIGLQPGGPGISIMLATLEAVALLAILIAACKAGRAGPNRTMVITLGALSAGYLLLGLLGFGVDMYRMPTGAIRAVWMFVSRVQIWVVPIVAVVGMMRAGALSAR